MNITTAQSRIQQNYPDLTTRPQLRAFLNELPEESDETTEKGKFYKWIAALEIETTAQSRLQQNSPDFTTRPQHRAFYINFLENRTRPQRKVNFKMDCCAQDLDNSAVKATANSPDFTTRPQYRAFYINCLENRTRPRRKVNFKMNCCALNRDNSAVKATAKFSRLHNETTAPSFFIIIAWRIGRDHEER